ncbi:MAG: IscS subfamily cysteine desulfurase [Candidatus Marinimicrobia bacterium]|nr:IscS subfamily cysteine desulfurase [Candidatus Neomarinimicrobiota bacterium]
MNKIYLDNQATTPLDPAVLDAMMPYLTHKFGNAASRSHAFGWEAEEAVDIAREQVANLISATPQEIIFTSGATESINLALKGSAQTESIKKHIITFKTEHKAVLDICEFLENSGFEVTYLPVNSDGLIDLDKLKLAIREDTFLVSVLHANNEIGVIQPIAEIGEICKNNNLIFHIDAAQSVGKIPIDVEKMNIHLLSFSAHKIYGPKGCGALYVRRKNPRIELTAIIHGGGHEKGFRSGTLAVHNIVGLGKACEISRELMDDESIQISLLRDKLLNGLKSEIPNLRINGSMDNRLAGNLNVCFPSTKSDSIMMSMRDIALSSGSACTSASIQPSHVLKALGLNKEQSHASIRFGIGRFNTETEIEYTIEKVVKTVNRFRKVAV